MKTHGLIPSHITWIKHVGHDYFVKKNIEPMDYIRNLITENFKYDELAILVFARMYHIHIKIVTLKGCWVTNK